jgi:tetratricopeptide (TPR) repeat protein
METLKQAHSHRQVIALMRTYCLQLPSLSLMKTGMEFLYINGFYDDLQVLIKKNEQTGNPSNQQWATIYQLLMDRRMKRYSPHQLLQEICQINTEEPELSSLIGFVKVTLYYDLNKFNKIGNFLHQLQQFMATIQDSLIKSYFDIRLHHVMLTYYLIRNELIMARKHGFKVLMLTDNPETKASVHIKLALSYTFDTYEQGMYHLREALKIAKQNHLKHTARIIENYNIPFLSAHFNQTDHIVTDDKSEQAHIEIARGNKQKAIEILNELPMDSPFQLYYLGKAMQDRDILLQSYNHFIKERSDYFFSRLPLYELNRVGNDSTI